MRGARRWWMLCVALSLSLSLSPARPPQKHSHADCDCHTPAAATLAASHAAQILYAFSGLRIRCTFRVSMCNYIVSMRFDVMCVAQKDDCA